MPKLTFKTINISKYTNAAYGKGKYKGEEIWFNYGLDTYPTVPRSIADGADYTGLKQFRNIPFSLDKTKQGRPRMVVLGGEKLRSTGYQSSVTIKLNGKADRIIFATATDFYGIGGLPHGDAMARATVKYKGGAEETFLFRLFFETAPVVYRWGSEPFRSWISRDTLWDDPQGGRDRGKDTFLMVTNTLGQNFGPIAEWLFPWENPHPKKELISVEFESVGAHNFLLIGLTQQKGKANPLHRDPKKKLLVQGPKGKRVDVTAERGQVFRKRNTAGKKGAAWLNSKLRGRGDYTHTSDDSKLHVDVFTAPDEDITVTVDGARKAVINSAELDAKTSVKKNGVSVRKLNVNEKYINVRILDENGKPTAARVHFEDCGGRYLAPGGHPEMPRTEWGIQTGGDCVDLGTPYAYVNGDFKMRVPEGELAFEVVKGFEYKVVRSKVDRVGNTLTIRLKRAFNEKQRGFYSADTHVHFLSPTSALLESEAEDVDVTNILASQWGDLYTDTWAYTGGLSKVSTKDNLIWVGQENRQHSLGHSSLLGLKEPIYPFCTGDPDEAELGAELECVIGEWMEKTRAQGGVSLVPHFPYPICENASLIMNDLVDAVEFSYSMVHEPQELYAYYYSFLNLGQRVPIVGGTDKMANTTILGRARTFASLGKGKALTYDGWAEAVRKGRCYSSLGPIIEFEADGKQLGDTIGLGKGGGSIEVRGAGRSVYPYDFIEVVVNGKRAARAKTVFKNGVWSAKLKDKIKVTGSCWLALRAGSNKKGWPGTAAHSSPIYVKVKGTEVFSRTSHAYVAGLVRGSEYTIREKAALSQNAELNHLLRYIDNAKEVLHHKIHHATQDHGH